MSKLDIEWLVVFDEIYQTANVSRAAERLGIAQGTASLALTKLRVHFGDKLFSRTSRGMEPTVYARQIHPEVTEILARLGKIRDTRLSFDPHEESRIFRIGMTDTGEEILLPKLVTHFRHAAPHIRLEAEHISSASVQRLEAGDLDLAVGYMPLLDTGFYQQVLFKDQMTCMLAARHPRIGENLSKEAFFAEGHIVISTSGAGHSVVKEVMEQIDVQRDIVLVLPGFPGVARIVAQTDLLVIVPGGLGQAFTTREKVRLLPLPFDIPAFPIKQHWHERFHADPGNIWLRRTIATLLSEQGA